MERAGFFNSVDHDRTYGAQDWASYFASFIGNGVFPNPSTGLQVTAGADGLAAVVKPGKAWINGYYYENTGDLNLTLAAADGLLKRVDRVVVQWNLLSRTVSIKVKSSNFGQTATAPELRRDAEVYELAIADIEIGAGAVKLTQGNIKDQRQNSALCGLVHGTVEQVDTEEFSAQLDAWFEAYKAQSTQDYADLKNYMDGLVAQSDAASVLCRQNMDAAQEEAEGALTGALNSYTSKAAADYQELSTLLESLGLQGEAAYATSSAHLAAFESQASAQFNAWFQGLQDVLDADAAAALLSRIEQLEERAALMEAALFNQIDAHPFIVQFDTLDGVVAEGVWNATAARLEC